MNVETQIADYLATLPDAKPVEMKELDRMIWDADPGVKVWFLNGRNEDGKVVTNPNIGYGSYTIKYANGTEKELHEVGLSANTKGISVYIMGLDDKKYLEVKYGLSIGKASVTSYCISFKSISEIDLNVLMQAIRERLLLE
jgi:hypothetical protein